LKEYYDTSRKEYNLEMMEKYYNKIKELKELKILQIKKNESNSYNNELSSLKVKQKYLYDDFIDNYNNKKRNIDFKYKTLIDITKKNDNKELQNIKEKNIIREEKYKNKNILWLEKKIKICLKLNQYIKAEKAYKEIKNEKGKLINEKKIEKEKTIKIKLNNLKIKQSKKMNKMILNYEKEKNELEIKYQKEKYELFQKFKNELLSLKEIHTKKRKIEKNYLYNNNNNLDNKFNQSFDEIIMNKKIEEDEETISMNY
jgi:hypothetical protein